MTGSHREVERKLDVDAAFVLPDLGGVAGVASVDQPVEHALEAVYHDTPDLRLARARVTLRRRTGGADAGWHLQLPGDRGARQEVHAALGRAATVPPKALRELVLGLTRGAPTEPVATLRTRRIATVVRDEEGRALAEIADDTVHGTAFAPGEGSAAGQSTWREVEVELVDGDEDLLARLVARLTDAGASPATAASKAGRVLADRLAQSPGAPRLPVLRSKKKGEQRPTGADVVLAAVRTQVEALRTADLMVRTSEPDGVHKFRVACRRLRSILAAFRSVLDRTATDPVREELRWLGEQLSDARDSEVALAHLRELVAEQPPEQVPGPVAARLQQAALQEEVKGTAQAARTLRSERYLRLLDALEALLADPPLVEDAGEPADRVLVAGIRRTTKRLRHRIDDARQASPDRAHTLHEVRKAAKRVRYTGEVGEGVLGRRAADLVAAAKQVQEVLGAHQDTELTRSWCERLGRGAFAAGENPWAFGRLHALEEARAARAREEFWELEPSLHPVLEAARKKS